MAIVSPSTDAPKLQPCDPVDINRPIAPHRRRKHWPRIRITRFPEWPADLPTEIALAIFKFLPQADLARACRVCRSWNIIASDASLWREVDLTYISRKRHIAPFSRQRLSSAESLIIYGLFDMPPKSIDRLLGVAARNNPRLTSVTFRSAVDLPSKVMRSLWESATNLRHVDLSWCLQIRTLPILNLVNQCPTLVSLNLSHTKITTSVLRSLRKLEYLTDLSLEGCFRLHTYAMCEFIQSGLPPRLSRLNLSYLYSIKGEWLVQMSSRVTLKLLDVRYAEWITRSDIRKMSQRWGNKCQILTTARLETDDERGWKQFVDELVEADVIV